MTEIIIIDNLAFRLFVLDFNLIYIFATKSIYNLSISNINDHFKESNALHKSMENRAPDAFLQFALSITSNINRIMLPIFWLLYEPTLIYRAE